MSKITPIICFNCANLFSESENGDLGCPECGFTVEHDLYQKLLNYAAETVEFGYHYRLTYEADFNEGRMDDPKVRTRYAIGFDDIWIFIALAALSGIVGNAAYDLVKLAATKIINRQAGISNRSKFKTISRMLENEKRFEIFIKYIQDFHQNGVSTLPPKIAGAVAEEMLVHEVVPLFPANREGMLKPLTEAELKQIYREALRRILSKQKLKEEDFEGFWMGLDKPHLVKESGAITKSKQKRAIAKPSKSRGPRSTSRAKKKSNKSKR